MRIARKKSQARKQKKNHLRTGFKVEKLPPADWFGFELDGDGRYLLGDFTVTHNTILASEIIRRAAERGTQTLFLAHRRELIQQTSEKLKIFDVPHGIIQAGKRPRYEETTQVASVQTLVNRLDCVEKFGLIFIDEAHHASAESYQSILNFFPEAKVIGLTATPWRLDGKGLADIFDAHVVVSTPQELNAMGFLCPVRAVRYEQVDTNGVGVRNGDFDLRALSERATLIVGDVVQQFKQHSNGASGIAFACDVAHSRRMAQVFCDAGITAEHVDGGMGHTERAGIFARLRAGTTRVLTNCNIATEGFDLPELTIAMLCRPTLSESLALQMAGRVLRPAPGKSEARIHDHAGIIENFGHPYDADRDFSPRRSAKKKRSEFVQGKIGGERKPRTIEEIAAAKAIEVEAVKAREAARVAAESRAAAERQKAKNESPEGRARRFAKFYPNTESRVRQLAKLIERHGWEKGQRVIEWQSGGTYTPSHEHVDLAMNFLDEPI
jgi:superfamily II DNA or RNA helicase